MSQELLQSLRPEGHALIVLDQRKLPGSVKYLTCTRGEQVIDAIKQLAVRGAPAIGIAGAYGLWLFAKNLPDSTQFEADLDAAVDALCAARPTAVNLTWAVTRARQQMAGRNYRDAIGACRAYADDLLADDIRVNRLIGDYGLSLFSGTNVILTHCNTGALATGGYGTALGVIRSLFREQMLSRVYVDETRPLLQGARLTAWELAQEHIPAQLIADSMAAAVMAHQGVDAVIVGADRIARNGDTANKIGTYSAAVLARYHRIPFYVAAPLSTFDPDTRTGEEIPIEMRDPEELRTFAGAQSSPSGFPAFNPAFDVTPGALVTAFITEHGIIRPPYGQSIAALLAHLL